MSSAKGEYVRVDLQLGSLEMSLSDLVSLRPGTKIGFCTPSVWEGTLLLGGAPLYRVSITIEDENANLKIISVFEETFSTNARCTSEEKKNPGEISPDTSSLEAIVNEQRDL